MQRLSFSNRFYPVKMSMQVSFTSHSHLIGRGGQVINSVMKDTMTKIHFPDENRNPGERKSNEVTISGELINVDEARRRIRSLTPVEFIIECRMDRLEAYGRQALVSDFAARYGVLVRMPQRSTFPLCSVTIRGSQHEINGLKEAVKHLMELCNNPGSTVAVKMEVSAENMRAIEASLPLLENTFSTGISFFRLNNEREDYQVIWMRGSFEGVYQAKLALMELLPLKLMFHVHACHLQFDVNVRKLAKRLDVAVKMEASSKPNSFLLHIISYERNAGNIYEFRRQILHLPNPNGVSPIGSSLVLPKMQETQLSPAQTLTTSPRFRETVESHPPPIPSTGWPPVRNLPGDSGIIPASLCALKFDASSYRQLVKLLAEMDLSEYNGLFLSNEVDLAMFSTLGDEDLKAIGILSFRDRKLMLQAIEKLKGNPAFSLHEACLLPCNSFPAESAVVQFTACQ